MNNKPLKLIVENPICDREDLSILREHESEGGIKSLFISGPYTRGDTLNKNGRIYPLQILREQVESFTEEFISTNRAIGELNHPTTFTISLKNACHLITDLKESDGTFIGKSRVLSTPNGKILECLINDNVQVGISSRSLGDVSKDEFGRDIVTALKLITWDIVAQPSSEGAFVNGILESKQYILDDNDEYTQIYENFERSLSRIPNKQREQYIVNSVKKFMNSLRCTK